MDNKRVTIERWEDDEFIICIDGNPVGGTISEAQAKNIPEYQLRILESFINSYEAER